MIRRYLVSFLILCSLGISAVQAVCPWAESNLVNWNADSSRMQENANVNIPAGTKVLLNVSPPKLRSITISGDLVIANQNLQLNVDYIRVQSGGKFRAGSDETNCQITNKFVVTFFGDRTNDNVIGSDADNIPFGAKGMAVSIGATLELHGRVYGPSWTRLTKTVYPTNTTIELENSVAWPVGSEIVLASTDFGPVVSQSLISQGSPVSWARGQPFPEQTETFTITARSGNVLTLSSPVRYMHWGAGYEKAEVGLLTRPIVFQGDEGSNATLFGGHLMIRKGASIHISGVEFTRFGQLGIVGRYPLHFHLLKDVINSGFYVKDCSVHRNFQRCIVLHDTNGLLVQNNVAYDTHGHCMFLEDGSEVMNTFDRNLAILARYIETGGIIPTDDSPSMYWIPNANNTFTNNVAVGGRFGFWLLMPDKVTGVAAADYANDPWVRPRCTPLGTFVGNVAHGAIDTCLEIDTFLKADGTTESGSYTPRIGPFDPTRPCSQSGGARVDPHFIDFTAYKCRIFGIWGQSSMRFTNIKLLDNRRAFMVNGVTVLEDSLIVGESDNIGTPRIAAHSRSFSDLFGSNNTQISGHESYDNGGPQFSKNNVFQNFVSRPGRPASALGVLMNGPFMLDTENRLLNLTFQNANEVYLNYRTLDAEYGWNILDIDGSTTKVNGGAWIVSANASHMLNDDCVFRENWNAYVCPPFGEGYSQITLINENGQPGTTGSNGVDYPPPPGTRVIRGEFIPMNAPSKGGKISGAAINCAIGRCWQYMANVKPRGAWTIRFLINEFQANTPSKLSVNMHSSAPGDWVLFSIPYPTSALPFTVTYRGYSTDPNPVTMTRALSTQSLTRTSYFYDEVTEHLYVMLYNDRGTKDFTEKWGFTDYNSNSPYITIEASCGDSCAPTKLAVPPVPSFGAYAHDEYRATLSTCQIAATGTTRPASGVGSGFFYFYPALRQLHYNIYHDLTASVTTVRLFQGGYANNGVEITTKDFMSKASPLRGVFTLTRDQWESLARGRLFIRVDTTTRPNGHLRGQIQCLTTCTPALLATVSNPCVTTGQVLQVYNDSRVNPFSDFTWNHNTDPAPTFRDMAHSEALCGNSSIKLGMRRGGFGFSVSSSNMINVSPYKYLEFYVKVASGFGETVLAVNLKNSSNHDQPAVAAIPDYVENFIVDEYRWTRVRIPLSALLPVGHSNSRGFNIRLNDWNSVWKEFMIDEIRFVSADDAFYSSSMPRSEVIRFDPDICANGGAPLPTLEEQEEGSSATALTSSFMMIFLSLLYLLF